MYDTERLWVTCKSRMVDSTTDNVRLVFRIKKHCDEPTSEQVGIVGNHARLGEWITDLAPRTNFIGHGEWQLETRIPASTILHFKLFCVDTRSNHVRHFENVSNRELRVQDQPLYVQLEYNRPNICNIKPMTSQLTNTGNPAVLPGLKTDTRFYFPAVGDSDIEDVGEIDDYLKPELHSPGGERHLQAHPQKEQPHETLETATESVIKIQMARFDEEDNFTSLEEPDSRDSINVDTCSIMTRDTTNDKRK